MCYFLHKYSGRSIVTLVDPKERRCIRDIRAFLTGVLYSEARAVAKSLPVGFGGRRPSRNLLLWGAGAALPPQHPTKKGCEGRSPSRSRLCNSPDSEARKHT